MCAYLIKNIYILLVTITLYTKGVSEDDKSCNHIGCKAEVEQNPRW